MKEHFYAYKIREAKTDLVCTYSEFEEEKMIDVLRDIKESHSQGLFWIFKGLEGDNSHEPFAIIDCENLRVYFHYSGVVEDLDVTISKLSR